MKNNLENKNDVFLITGANGFVGRHLCKKIKTLGINLKLLVRTENKSLEEDYFVCNLGSQKIKNKDLSGVNTIVHLASVTHDTNFRKEEKIYRLINVDATIDLAKAAARNGVRCFIFLSSVKAEEKVFSPNDNDSSDRLSEGIYGATKRAAELALMHFSKKINMQIIIIRSALIYGNGVKGNLASMIGAIEKGWFPPIPPHNNRRSMIHVNDLVDAIVLVSKNDKAHHQIFTITDDHVYSTYEIYTDILKALGKEIPSWSIPLKTFYFFARLGDFLNGKFGFPFNSYKYNKLFGDDYYPSDKIKTIFGFKAKRTFSSSIEEIIRERVNR